MAWLSVAEQFTQATKMKSRRILSKMFLSEAVLEFPDGEIDSLNRVLAGAARRGAIPRDALENWPMIKGSIPKTKADEPKKPQVAKSKEKAPEAPAKGSEKKPEPSSRTGRVIPATNRFRQDSTKGSSPISGGTAPKPSKPIPKGPGVAKRAISAIRGKDPESGLPKPKSAVTKVHGRHEPASLPRLDRMFGDDGNGFSDDEKTDPGYVSPFAHLSGLSGGDEDDDDPKVAAIKKGFSQARAKSGPKANVGFPEADVWNKFSGGSDSNEPQPKRKQGRLSRLFKGRRDDDI